MKILLIGWPIEMIRFILLTFGIWLFVLILATLIVNLFKLNDHKGEKLKQVCHPIMVPFNNSYFFVYPCTTE